MGALKEGLKTTSCNLRTIGHNCALLWHVWALSKGNFRHKMTTIVGNRGQLWISTLSPHVLSSPFRFSREKGRNRPEPQEVGFQEGGETSLRGSRGSFPDLLFLAVLENKDKPTKQQGFVLAGEPPNPWKTSKKRSKKARILKRKKQGNPKRQGQEDQGSSSRRGEPPRGPLRGSAFWCVWTGRVP